MDKKTEQLIKEFALNLVEQLSDGDKENLDATLFEIADLLKEELQWLARDIKKDFSNVDAPDGMFNLPYGYKIKNITEYSFEVWRIDPKGDKLIAQFAAEGATRRSVLMTIYEFERNEAK